MSTFIKLRYVLSASSFTVICLITLFGCNNSDPVGKVNSELNREQLERAANSNYFDIFRRANDLYITIGNSQSNPSTESILTTMNRTASMVSVADPSNVDPTLVAIVTEYSEKMYRLRGSCLKLSQSRSTQNVTNDLLESFLRGAAGDPFGKTLEVMERDRRLTNQINQYTNQLDTCISRANSRAVQLGIITPN